MICIGQVFQEPLVDEYNVKYTYPVMIPRMGFHTGSFSGGGVGSCPPGQW